MISILHTADWHIGQTFFRSERDHEHQHFFDWLISTIDKEDIDVLLIAGDVFDVSNPSATAQNQFFEFIQKAKSTTPHLQIVITAGNHDSASRLEAPLPILKEMNIHIQGVVPRVDGEIDYDKMIVPLYNKSRNIEAYCLAVPYLRQGDYPKVESENPYEAGVKELYKKLFSCVEQRKTKEQGIVAMGHLLAVNFKDENNERSEKVIVGGLESVSLEVFRNFNYTALGHIHKSQKVKGCDHIRYSGSPLSMSFAEKHYKHGVVKVTIDQGKTIAINKIDYEPLVKLISIPSQGSCVPEEAISLLRELPDRSKGCISSLYDPFLEVRVLIKEPETQLVEKLNKAVEGKAVRLVRIRNEYNIENKKTGENEELINLNHIEPLEIANRIFQDKYGEPMSDKLVELFNIAYEEVRMEE